MKKVWNGLRVLLMFCIAPFLAGAMICLLFFPPTWLLLWLVSKPQHQEAWLRFKVKAWEEWWHVRGALLPQHVSPQTRGLYQSIASGDVYTLQMLLERGADPNARLFYGMPLLVQAAENGFTPIVSMLLQAGATLEARCPILRYTALIQAARNGHAETVACLLLNGADATATDVSGDEALIAAVHGRQDGAVRVLLAHYQRQPSLPSVCRLALIIARKRGFNEIAQMLIESGVEVDNLTRRTTERISTGK